MQEIGTLKQLLGFDSWFQNQTDNEKSKLHELARVVSVQKDSYLISNGVNEVFAELIGKLMYTAESALDLPTIGDWVYADFYDENTHAIIHEVLPRKSVLKRKTSGKNIEFQLIAANIDVAFIMQSLNRDFNLRRLERYLVMTNESSIEPIVLLSKSDLLTVSDIENKLAEIAKVFPELRVIAFSNESGNNLEQIRSLLSAGKTYCLLGSSGVGKTTLLNSIVGEASFETAPIREKDSKGKHTTTNRQLVRLNGDAMLIDTPGMRELGNMSVDSGLEETFADIVELSQHCKFGDCSHVSEKGCAILAAIESNDLEASRFQNFQGMKKEASYFEMSYVEKRHKDKKLGKLIKSVTQAKYNRK